MFRLFKLLWKKDGRPSIGDTYLYYSSLREENHKFRSILSNLTRTCLKILKNVNLGLGCSSVWKHWVQSSVRERQGERGKEKRWKIYYWGPHFCPMAWSHSTLYLRGFPTLPSTVASLRIGGHTCFLAMKSLDLWPHLCMLKPRIPALQSIMQPGNKFFPHKVC